MKGYYKRPDLTAEVIDSDGWFHTGDIGELAEGRYLKITDRKKEMFKTSGGKYIAPQVLENKFKECVLIEQIMVVGEGQKFPAALIIPSEDGLKDWCERKEISFSSVEEVSKHKMFLEKIETEIEYYNEGFAQYEKIKKFKVMGSQWTVETGELTPTMKLKRKIIKANYKADIDAFYGL